MSKHSYIINGRAHINKVELIFKCQLNVNFFSLKKEYKQESMSYPNSNDDTNLIN